LRTDRVEISRDRPGLLVFLLDQSNSMGQAFGDTGFSKAEAVALTVNLALDNLVMNCQPEGEPEDYYHVIALGYGGEEVRLVFGGELEGRLPVTVTQLADNPIRFDTVTDDDIERTMPVWINPTNGGKTPMVAALSRAADLVAEWLQDFPDSVSPIVLNITDGAPSDGDPTDAARRLSKLKSKQGPALLFNLRLTRDASEAVEFPDSDARLESANGRRLYAMSSVLPTFMRAKARELGVAVTDRSRGFVHNGNMVNLVHFLTIGTTPAA